MHITDPINIPMKININADSMSSINADSMSSSLNRSGFICLAI